MENNKIMRNESAIQAEADIIAAKIGKTGSGNVVRYGYKRNETRAGEEEPEREASKCLYKSVREALEALKPRLNDKTNGAGVTVFRCIRVPGSKDEFYALECGCVSVYEESEADKMCAQLLFAPLVYEPNLNMDVCTAKQIAARMKEA